MKRSDLPAGYPLTARPPLRQFTRDSRICWSGAGVFLFDYQSQPYWFATNGHSAILTPAMDDEFRAEPSMFPPAIGKHHVYRQDHIKNLFKYVKGKRIVYAPDSGYLFSPDGIMQIPPFVHEADEGQEPEPVTMPDVEKAFEGEPIEVSCVDLNVNFVQAIRGAFSHLTKSAFVSQTFLDGGSIRFDITEPYYGQILLAGSPVEEPEQTTEEAENNEQQ